MPTLAEVDTLVGSENKRRRVTLVEVMDSTEWFKILSSPSELKMYVSIVIFWRANCSFSLVEFCRILPGKAIPLFQTGHSWLRKSLACPLLLFSCKDA
jgi:hypothetical protein